MISFSLSKYALSWFSVVWFLGEVSTKQGRGVGGGGGEGEREGGKKEGEGGLMSGVFRCGSVPHFDTRSLTKPRVL